MTGDDLCKQARLRSLRNRGIFSTARNPATDTVKLGFQQQSYLGEVLNSDLLGLKRTEPASGPLLTTSET